MACFSLKRTVTTSATIAAIMILAGGPPAEARDFFTSFFSGFGRPAAQPAAALPFASEPVDIGMPSAATPAPARISSGVATAFCVRTCDGRYFPLPAPSGQSRAATCKSFCPASETKVFVGGTIDNASASDSGKSYSSMPNAFRYRTELVNGCTCNGKDSGGLAHIKAEDDPTLRKGDLVAGPGGSLVASRSAELRSVSAGYSPGRSVRAILERLPVVAAE